MTTPYPIQMGYTTGKNCYALAFNPDGRVLDIVNKVWTSFILANIANYFMTYTEIGSTGFYTANYPDGFVLDVLPTEVSYQRAGPAPALPDDLPIISIGQSQGANVAAINQLLSAASNLSVSAAAMIQGAVQNAAISTTAFTSDLTSAVDATYVGRVIIMTSGAVVSGAAIVTGYNATTKVLTFTALAAAPAVGDTFVLV